MKYNFFWLFILFLEFAQANPYELCKKYDQIYLSKCCVAVKERVLNASLRCVTSSTLASKRDLQSENLPSQIIEEISKIDDSQICSLSDNKKELLLLQFKDCIESRKE